MRIFTETNLRKIHLVLFGVVSLLPVSFLNQIKIGPVPLIQIVFLAGTALLFSGTLRFGRKPKADDFLMWGLLLAGLFTGLIASSNKTASLATLVSFVIRGLVVGWFLQFTFDLDDATKTIHSMCLIVTFCSLACLLKYYFRIDVLFLKTFERIGTDFYSIHGTRLAGPVGHPVPFSVFIAMFVPIVLTAPFRFNAKAAILVLLGLALAASQSRSGILSATVGVITVLVLISRGHKINLRYKWILPSAVGLILLFSSAICFFGGGHFKTGFKNAGHRLGAMRMSEKVIHDHPWFGLGLGRFPHYYLDYIEPGMYPEIASPDNQYLRWAMETGFIGILFFAAFSIVFIKKIYRIYSSYSLDLPPLLPGLIGAATGTALALFFFDGLDWFPVQFSFWSVAGLILSFERRNA